MTNIKTLNSISSVVREVMGPTYDIRDDADRPEGILVRSAKCHDMVFNPELLAIARAGAGVNNIPLDRCTQSGIVVFNTPGANANAVKELVFAAMMMSSRNLLEAVEWCKTLKGQGAEVPALVEKSKSRFVGSEVRGKKLGVIGLGAIGVLVANEGAAIGLEVSGFDPFISVEHAWKLSRAVRRADSLEDLVSDCDYISLHVPLSKSTKGYFSAKLCEKVKKGATLMNFSRGELVDIDAVLASLEVGQLRRYITDFPSDEVIGVPNVICIPHLGASTPESEENCAAMAAEELKDYIENGNIKHSVNLPDCELPPAGRERICIINANMPNMIGQFTAALSAHGANITNMLNKSRGDYAYTMIDLDETAGSNISRELSAINGVIRLRVIER